MRVDTRVDYSIYYDEDWKHYFNNTEIDNRKLIGFKTHLSSKASYVYDTFIIPFSDSGFHALYLTSEIMKFDKIYLIGYDYKLKDGKWHPYEDDFITRDMHERKLQILDKQVNKYSEIKWQADIYNCNESSNLKLFKFELPYKNKKETICQ